MRKSSLLSVGAILIVAGMLFQPAFAFAQSEYDIGYADGQKAGADHLTGGKKAAWVVCGALTGIIGTAVAYLHKPKSTANNYIRADVSREYEDGFVDGFCKKVNGQRTGYCAAGWALYMVIFFAGSAG